MTLWLIAGLGLAVTVACAIPAARGGIDASFGWIIGIIAGGLAALIFGVLLIGRHYDRMECASFARTTGRATKFVNYTAFSWDCLTPVGNGRWIPTKNLREFGSKP